MEPDPSSVSQVSVPLASVEMVVAPLQFESEAMRMPPLVMTRPPAVEIPPVKVEEAEPVWFKAPTFKPLVTVDVPAPATERRPVKVPPPVTARPFEEERPAVWRPPAMVEEAPVPVRLRKVD
jgi:hypothetical protein